MIAQIRIAPTFETALQELSAILPTLQHAMEAGTQKAAALWESQYTGQPVDPWLYSNLVRHEAKRVLAIENVHSDYVTESLPLSGLALAHGRFDIKILKAGPDGEGPAPGGSLRRQSFFNQLHFDDPAISDGGTWSLLVLYHLGPMGELEVLTLACPREANTRTAEYFWHRPIPNVLETYVPATTTAEDEPEDLQYTLDTPATGTNEEESE